MDNNVSVLWCHVIVRVACSMTNTVNIDKMASHSEQDTRRRREREGRGRIVERTIINTCGLLQCVVVCCGDPLPSTRLL